MYGFSRDFRLYGSFLEDKTVNHISGTQCTFVSLFTHRCEVRGEEGLLETREHRQGDEQDLARVPHVADGGRAQLEARGHAGGLLRILIRCILKSSARSVILIFEVASFLMIY